MPTDADAETDPANVPSGVLREANEKRRVAETKVADYERELATLRPIAPQFDALKSEFEKSKSAWAEERAGLSVGLDAEGVGIARHVYGQQPETDRKPFPDWLQGLKADPSKAPKPLTPWFPPAAAGTGNVEKVIEKPVDPAGGRQADAGGGGGAGAGSLTATAVNAMIAKGEKGDWTEYNQHREAILRGIANGTLRL